MDPQSVSMSGRPSRREVFKGFMAASMLGAALTSCGPGESIWAGARWRDFLGDVAALLIPATATLGGGDIYIWAQDVALNAIYVGLDDVTLDMVAAVEADLDGRCGGHYLASSDDKRYHALDRLDAESYRQPLPQTTIAVAWRKIKGLLLLGYYTSEIGASKELRYELVPGRFDSVVKVTPDTRAISSDWFAVSFR